MHAHVHAHVSVVLCDVRCACAHTHIRKPRASELLFEYFFCSVVVTWGRKFYFLLAFWGFVLGVVLIRIIYETILENYKRWFKSFIESLIFFLKSLLGISMLFGVVFLGVYLFEKLDIKIPIYANLLGANIVEKHLKINERHKCVDSPVSITGLQFKELKDYDR
mgnify:CR=1 FL=1